MPRFIFQKIGSQQPSKLLEKPTQNNWIERISASVGITGIVGLISLFASAPAYGEGSAQWGLNQRLFEYGDVSAGINPAQTRISSASRAFFVDILDPNEVINISACGTNNTNNIRIEIYNTTPNIIDPTFIPNTGSLVTSTTLNNGNIGTCSNSVSVALPSDLSSTAWKYTPGASGTYEIRLYNDNGTYLNRVDITVTPNSSSAVDPYDRGGRLYAYDYGFNAGSFSSTAATDTDFFVKVPGGLPGENFVWQLDLNNFAGFVYEIVANSYGVNPPYSGYSVPYSVNTDITPEYPIYLSFPDDVGARPVLSPGISGFKFTDNAGEDNAISPGSTIGVQDSGTFSFSTNVIGNYSIQIDVNQDGIYSPVDASGNLSGDVFINGLTDGTGTYTQNWDGTDAQGNNLPVGTYNVKLDVRIGEYHFIASDAETSGGGTNNGLTIFEALSSTHKQDTSVFWDDATYLSNIGGTTNLPAGALSSSPQGRHTWGNFTGSGFGNQTFIDTYVYGDASSFTVTAIISDDDIPTDVDYGDAPTSGSAPDGAGTNNYGDARHTIVSGLYLGAGVPDVDASSQASAAADGDDNDGSDDEDGVTIPALFQGQSATVDIDVSGAGGYLQGWIDWNGDGDFADAGEQIATDVQDDGSNGDATANDGTINLLVTVPANAIISADTFGRFRWSTIQGLDTTTGASDGEVEDYQVAIALHQVCPPDTDNADPSITPYISDEVRGNNSTTRTIVDSLDDSWRTAVGLPQTGTVQPWFGAAQPLSNAEPNLFTYSLDNQTISVGVALVNMAPSSDCAGSVHTGSTAELNDSNTLQDNAPRPASLYDNNVGATNGHPAMWNENVGATGSPNGVLFTFSQPVRAFGAWFGDVETRTDGNGTPAYLRLLDINGDRIGADIAIQPHNLIEGSGTSLINQASCGSTATDEGCGNQSTRWISFIDNSATPRVAQALLIVGDDDEAGDGYTEHISFIGLDIIPSDPNVLLVKRITVLNGGTTTSDGDDLALYLDETDNPYDDNDITVADAVNPGDPPKDTDQWPNITANLLGGINGGNVIPDDEIEYTIYFLSAGDTTAESVLFCDYVPMFTGFIPNGYAGGTPQASGGIGGADLSIELFRDGSTDYHTGANDGDSATYFGPGIDPANSFPGIDCDGDGDGVNANVNGAVIVNLGDLPSATSDVTGAYGYVRFRARVK